MQASANNRRLTGGLKADPQKHIGQINKIGGFGIVEVMVGLVVGLISMVVVMQLYSGFEGQKRSTTTGSDAQSDAAIALYLMEREIKMGGNGMSEGVPGKTPPLAGCNTWMIDKTDGFWQPSLLGSTVTAAGVATQVRLAPAIISDGGGGVSDTLSIVYGTTAITAPYDLAGNFTSGGTVLSLISRAGINAGDMLALVQEDPVGSTANYRLPRGCALLQATGNGAAAGQVDVAASSRYNAAFATAGNAGVFDGSSGSKEAQVYNLGQLNIVTYRVENGNLVADSSKFGVIPDGTAGGGAVTNFTLPLPLASGIVNMQVQYGVDTGNPGTPGCNHSTQAIDADSIVDAWTDATGVWANNATGTSPGVLDLRRVRAVRIGLVARSSVLEKDCATAPPSPNAIVIDWETGPSMNPDLSADANWQCYRYKVYQTTISLRNTVWSSTLNPASDASCR